MNVNQVNTWSSLLDGATLLVVGLIWLGVSAFFYLKQKKSYIYLLFFSIFYVYLVKVLDYTSYQYQSLILLNHFTSGLMLNGQTAEKSLNLVPLITLGREDVTTSLLNILLFLPFGFGLPFITTFRMRKVVLIGMLFSVGIESLQLISGRIGNITFRIADINDVIFNTLGVALGYMLFVGFIRIYRHVLGNRKVLANPILGYIADRPQFAEDN